MFIDDIKASKTLFRQIAERRRLGKQEIDELEEIKGRYNISAEGTVATQKALAELMGVSPRTIINWKDEGMPVEPDGSYDPLKVIAWRSDTFLDGSPDGLIQGELKTWDIAYRKYRALLGEVEYKKAIGELIPREDVVRLLVERATELKKSLLGMARRLSNRLANKTSKECLAIIIDDTTEILKTYSRPNRITGGEHGRNEGPDDQGKSEDAVREVPPGGDGL